jgi:branched-chain amino acid transport system ATP-binding protein
LEEPILFTKNLKKYFGDIHAVDGVDLKVWEKELVSIIGPNGSGKTTLVNLITGRIKPDEGKVFFKGKDVTGLSPEKLVKIGIARSFQITTVADELTALDNVRVAVLSRLRRSGKAFSLIDHEEEATKEAERLLKAFELLDREYSLAKELPYGDRRLLDVAICFALKPKLILLDEPTSGVSTAEKDTIMKRVSNVIRDEGITSLIVEHDMDIVFSYSDRIVAMHQGKILAEGKPDEIRMNEEVKNVIIGRGV